MVDQQEEAIVMMKGKRTKRPRPLSSLSLAMSSEEESGPRGAENYSDESMKLLESTVDSTSDEDMAHCLILLAQGSKSSRSIQLSVPTKPPYNNNNNNNNGNNNGNSYECKTCNKSFASFQALGGHRASHKKPKLGIGLEDHQTKKSSVYSLISDHNQAPHQLYDPRYKKDEIALSLYIANSSSASSNNNNNNNNNKTRVHECSICGAEFLSGQALGGHMRRHRPIGGTTSITTIPSSSQSVHVTASNSPNNPSRDNQENKTHNLLSLDLNLPAPEDDHHQHQHQHQQRDNSKFVFPLNGKTLAFSASSLVDCHY